MATAIARDSLNVDVPPEGGTLLIAPPCKTTIISLRTLNVTLIMKKVIKSCLVSLKESNNSMEKLLAQYEIPTDDKSKMDIFVGCNTGGTCWLTNLKEAYLEHGITLHAKGLKQEETVNS